MARKYDIFISHVSADRKLACELQDCIREDFTSLEVFRSTDGGESIEAGEWFKQVKAAVQECRVMVVLCSPQSVMRPWVAFEAGAAWALKGTKVALLCHSHLRPEGLPSPFNQLQSMEIDLQGVNWVYELIAKKFDSIRRPPSQDRIEAAVRRLSRAESKVIVDRQICQQINAVMALSYRDGTGGREFLLVRTKGGDKWTFPKGSLEKVSDISDYQRYTRNELLEESGAAGEVFETYCEPFLYVKSNGDRRWVLGFAVRVDKMGIPSELSRSPRWSKLPQARELLSQGRSAEAIDGLLRALDFVASFEG